MTHRYHLYGRGVESDVPLPGVAAREGPIEWTVRAGVLEPQDGPWFHIWPTPDGGPWIRALRLGDRYRIRYEHRAEFEVEPSARIILCDARCPGDMLRHFLFDQVLPLALSLDSIVLHASSAAVDGGLAAFVGPGGSGKSTIALSLGGAGHPIGSDDGLLVHAGREGAIGMPSYPAVRVWHDSASTIAPAPPDDAAAPATAKCRYTEGFPFVPGPMALGRVYVLDPEPARSVRFAPLTAREAAMALVEQSYRLALDDRRGLARQLDDLARLARCVPAWRLSFPRDLSAWRALSAAIVDHASGSTACRAVPELV